MKRYTKWTFGLMLFTGLFLVGCKNTTDTKNLSALGSILNDKTIEVGYINYPPGFIVDPNTGKYSGIFNDVLVEIAKRNNLTINYKTPVTWATMIQDVNMGKVDIIANPVWATPSRKESADFSNPVYFSPIGVFVRANDDRFSDNYSNINNPTISIAAVQGEINNQIAIEDFPKAELTPFPDDVDVSQLFLEIESGKKDVTFAEPMFAYDYMIKNPDKIKNIGLNNPIRNYPNSYMIKKGETELIDFMNQNIAQLIKDGTIDKILDKYVPFEGAIISATDSLAIEKQ